MVEFETISTQNKQSVLGIYEKIYLGDCDLKALSDMMDKLPHIGFCGYSDNQLVGFISANHVVDELDIIELGVISEFRRRGIAHKFLTYLQHYCVNQNIKKIFLEVAENNAAAIGLYEKTGFSKIGIRKNYYSRKGTLIDGLAYCWNSMR
tara:strand:- start:78 stop:527 length:450 start_codon:yes stop_codon:yes gene_type:complete